MARKIEVTLLSPDLPRLGDKVREIVSGYEGITVGTCKYLWGCEQVLVSRADSEGKPAGEWFDVGRIEILERNALRRVEYAVATSGADTAPPLSG